MSKIEVDAITEQSGSTLTTGGGAGKTVVVDATTVTLGRCGGTVALASGASQTGFGRTGTVDWQTGSIKTSTFTAANGEGYFANTSGGAFTMNLPAGVAGNIVSVVDYTNTFQTNALTISPNGSEKIGGVAADAILSTEGQSVTFVYIDGTEGWKNVQDSTSNTTGNTSIVASGGTVTTCGDFKIHTFTGPGSFSVSQVDAVTAANNTVSYLVVAGGGGGSDNQAGAGGAGGFREFRAPVSGCYSVSPLNGSTPITITAQSYPIVIGGGGTGNPGSNGGNSTALSITSTGGGGGGATNGVGNNGGSGGGGGSTYPNQDSGSGNTPPVSPPQGNDGGGRSPDTDASGGGGGGATTAGSQGGNRPAAGGPGGAGATTSIIGSSTAYAGGGGSGQGGSPGGPLPGGAGGVGGGGNGSGAGSGGTAGADNTGGGGGSGGNPSPGPGAGASGGSGIVIIRYKFQ